MAVLGLGVSKTFQSTPDLINRENDGLILLIAELPEFQSTPDLINRENVYKACKASTLLGFNPLPI